MVAVCASAKPGIVAPLAYSSPLIGAPVVTAHSSQVVARNYNGVVAAPLIAAPVPVLSASSAHVVSRNINGLAAPLIAAPAPLAYSSPLGYASPYVASPYVASPYAALPYAASPYAAAYSPFVGGAHIASPVRYSTGGAVFL